ncbi:hypothetical protein [uncultured Variovorax sp.]|jgi:hypothetical protein|nr:hypothetical protein [uncultured Variovorax sp.]RSZ41159.1 hypothetical protein EJO70_14860 [Variovorax sp. 553]
MLFSEIDKVLDPYRTKLAELEQKAGIGEQADRAREGSMFPLGIDGDKVDPQEYFADEADYTRRGIRLAYFSVQDAELRRELIKTVRTLEATHQSLLDRDVGEAASEVSKAKVALRRLPWGTGAFIALLCFGVGEYSKGTSGAIAGGMLGLFMGLGYVWNAKGSAESTLEQAEFDLKSVQRDRRIRKLHPETFSRSEEVLGEEQEEFGDESARANVVRFLEENPA